uniref:Uncharacterized protein TCIL3000_11_15760 n=1 Tax=Trypanosoma congolense (strain IL3000) TaxID=1068625 RepID=G0V343_TRYCI|nr:unnamed protein product [Trypanosoma congolense IL3000]
MDAKIEDLLLALLRRFAERNIEVHPSLAFDVARDLVNAMCVAERRLQLARIITLLQSGEGKHVESLVSCSGALMISQCDGKWWTSTEDAVHWEELMMSILAAHPPFTRRVLASVSYCVVRVTLAGRGDMILRSVGGSLCGTAAGHHIPRDVSIEVLPYFADALVALHQGGAGEVKKASGETTGAACEIVCGPEVMKRVISYALDAIPCLSADAAQATYLSRRVLVPLLLLGDGPSMDGIRSRIPLLLNSLSSDKPKRMEAIVITAALFEYLFRCRNGSRVDDYRCSASLWDTIHMVLKNAYSSNESEESRVNMQLRVEYLLKRIVSITHEQEKEEKWCNAVVYHPLFVWMPGISNNLWEMFFLVLEVTNDYGMHIIQPALPKLDALMDKVALDTVVWDKFNRTGEEAELKQLVAGFHPMWVEILMMKMLTHPNVAFRKIGLMKLWSQAPSLLKLFSNTFLFTNAMDISLDTRLCAEVDRTPHLLSFFGPNSFEGAEVSVAGVAGPLGDQLGQFYATLFTHVVRDPGGRREAMWRMLHCVAEKPNIHGATMLFRILHDVAEALVGEECEKGREGTTEMITNGDVLREFMLVLRDAAQEKVPFWIDVRLSAIAFHILLQFARINTERVRGCADFWRVLCMCGPLGTSAGNSATSVDSIAQVGTVGTCLDPRFLNEHLFTTSCKVQCGGTNYGFMRVMLQADVLVENVRSFLRSHQFDETHGKQLMFLVGALDRGDECDKGLLSTVALELTETLLSIGRRPYNSVDSTLASLILFVEFHHSLGSQTCSRYFSFNNISEISNTINEFAVSSIRRALHSIKVVTKLEDFSEEAWLLQGTLRWDTVVAAIVSVTQIASCYHMSTRALTLKTDQYLTEFIGLLGDVSKMSLGSTAGVQSQGMVQRFAQIVVSRNASRVVKGILCGVAEVDATVELDAQSKRGEESLLHCTVEDRLPTWIRALMDCPALRLTTCDIPCSLTDLSWSTVLAQYYGSVYDSIFLLCNCVNLGAVPSLVQEIQEYGMDHVERCWGSNLTSVYTILSWVAAITNHFTDSEDSVDIDISGIINSMFSHLNDVGGREHCRMAVLAYDTLRYGLETEEELVKSHIRGALMDDSQSDRTSYVAAVMLSAEVLRNPAANWPRLKELLLHVAVLHNPSREEEMFEVLVSAMEPLIVAEWPQTMREQYPPTVQLSLVGRSMAISAILWCCREKEEWARDVSLTLLEWSCSHTEVSHEPCMPNSKPHRSRMRLWQLLCSLVPMIDDPTLQRDLLQKVVTKCLTLTNMGSVRRLIELYALQLLQKQPELYPVVDGAMADYTLRPQVLGSYVFLCAHVILQELRGEVKKVDGLMEKLLYRLFQQSTSHQHLLRLVCHIGLNLIHEACNSKGIKFSANEERMLDYISNAPEHVKFRVQHVQQLFFDIREASTPRWLFCTQRKEGNNILAVSLPAAAFERMRFVGRELTCLTGAQNSVDMLRIKSVIRRLDTHRLLEPFEEFPYIPHTERSALYCPDYTHDALALLVADPHDTAVSRAVSCSENIQRKATPWWSTQLYNELHPRVLKAERQSVIVVASLLQNPVNVAGLFRCGEVFAVERVVVSEPSVLEHPHFVAAARSANLWLPWTAVQTRMLSAYLLSMRQHGYALVGIEQTAGSVSIETYQFPKKCVIVLGAEGHGIPAHLLPLLDICVEIPQYGLIRSLNVHVTGSIVIYEYTRQHRLQSSTVNS